MSDSSSIPAPDVFSSLTLEDDEGQTFTCHKVALVSPERAKIYATIDPEIFSPEAISAEGGAVYSLACSKFEEGPDDICKEFLAKLSSDGSNTVPELLIKECQITCMTCAHSELVEYRFESPCDGFWQLAPVCQEALQSYIEVKFKNWHKQLMNPSCEAEFRRLLQNGLVTKIYDRMMFKTPDELKDKYEVIDEKNNNKVIHLPHPVQEMRVWNVAKNGYDTMDSRLSGAPSEEEEDKYWEELLGKFKEERGAEYIEGLIEGKKS